MSLGHDITCGLDLGMDDATDESGRLIPSAPTCPACVEEVKTAFALLVKRRTGNEDTDALERVVRSIAAELGVHYEDLRDRLAKPSCILKYAPDIAAESLQQLLSRR